jgi:NAD(P)-dependent dehydrogenase (short-subunit alcohol dehydrogenase family)
LGTKKEDYLNISGEMPLALITGAARRVGKLIALHLARKGYAIGLHFNSSESEAQQTAAEIREIGAPVYLFEADLAKEEEITDLFKKVNKVSHPLKVLVNSAAIMMRTDLMKIEIEDWDKIMNLNTRSVWLTTRESALRMRDGGVVINISDVGARKNWTGYGVYVVSKAAVETLTRLMARQLAPAVRVNAIAPGAAAAEQ